MLELPEAMRLARQMDRELRGRRIVGANRGNTTHKFIFWNMEEAEMDAALRGRVVRGARGEAKGALVATEDGPTLAFFDMGGAIRFHPDGNGVPAKHHFLVRFEDGSSLSVAIQGWGAIQVTPEEEADPQRYCGKGPDPLGDEFTPEAFEAAIQAWPDKDKKSIKALLVGGHGAAGMGNGYLHDVLFQAGVLPTRKVASLTPDERLRLHGAIRNVMRRATELGGRDLERDLYGMPGGYVPTLDKRAAGKPCPRCGTPIEKIAYLGGSCYYCPVCQK